MVASLLERHADIAPVIWAFPADTDDATIRRHLRNLNIIRVARRPRPRDPAPTGEEEVAFRHADGRIIASLLPLLRPSQIARLLGPASAFIPVTAHEVIAIQNDGTPAEAPGKPLSLDAAQVDQFEEPRYAPLDAAILAVLKRDHGVMENAAARLRIRDLRHLVLAHTGFRADQHICDLVEVCWHHGPEVLHRSDVVAVLTRAGWSQERRCATLKRKLVPAPQPHETA